MDRRADIDRLGPRIERRLDAALRHTRGQHFTSPDVADLVNAFCIRRADDRVLDPACGTGAFLVRARARLRHLGAPAALAATQLEGVELDPILARAARRNLPGAAIRTADFLDDAPAGAAPDAIVGNPPYVRQELIAGSLKRSLAARLPGASRRSDLHLYFWPPCLERLREGGRLGLVTSGAWLDAVYGGPLRRWLAARFRVVAILEPESESWFDDARVRAVVAIVERSAPAARAPTRVVRIGRRLADIAPPDLSDTERLARFDALARSIETNRPCRAAARARTVRPPVLARSAWGPLLRQPDVHFELLERARGLVPLEEVADVAWGIKTGDDRFFILDDAGARDIEPQHLSPVVFSLSELTRLIVTPGQLARRILLVDLRRHRMTPGLRRHVARAETERRSHGRPTCAAREREGTAPRRWFELRPAPAAPILWSIMHQYRHLVPLNPAGFPVNDNLLGVTPKPGIDLRLVAAILNSHVVALIKHAHGRQRNEGMLKTQAVDLKRMPIPDPRRAAPGDARRLTEIFDALCRRPTGTVPRECARPDRRRLDEATLRLLSFDAPGAREMAQAIGRALTGLYARERQGEIDAVSRRTARRRRRVSAGPAA